MPKQRFKSVYLTGYPGDTAQQRHLKLAFGGADEEIFEQVRHMSSQDVREVIGCRSYEDLQLAAQERGMTMNGFCLSALREQLPLDLAYRPVPDRPGSAKPDDDVNAIQATFAGGALEPMHRWFPYLEGYSPQFVTGVLRRYAPAARTILDPFAGTGTTPLTVAGLGYRAFYAEVNPVLQFLMGAKTHALFLTPKQRHDLARELDTIGMCLPELLAAAAPDLDLNAAYHHAFGESRFFEPATFESVLRSRTLIDDIACRSATLADLVAVGVVASLVPSSLLTRAGDLRYRTAKELDRSDLDFAENVSRQIRLIGMDLRRLPGPRPRHEPLLIAEDARQLDHLPALGIDAVVTSPPYLNGTNYFRNTKVELWFLRCLRSTEDLARFRTRSITAGINDVSARRAIVDGLPEVRELVATLEAHAYDPRIPKMVHSYFQDMSRVVEGLTPHLTAGAIVALDIGDSAYGGIHVPTDRLLATLLTTRGFRLTDEVVLRRRLSRGGEVLRQSLLVFEYTRPVQAAVGPPAKRPWAAGWDRFRRELPHQTGPFAKRNWGHPLHSLCSYQGKMKPSLAAHLIECFVPAGGSVLDPFAGVATIPFEAALAGRKGYGFDISPTALVIGSAKLGRPERQRCLDELHRLDEAIRSGSISDAEAAEAKSLGFNGKVDHYFHPDTLREVLLARRHFADHPPADASESLVMASLLHILHGNRPYALSRRSHPITPFSPTGDYEYRPLMPRLTAKVLKSLDLGLPEDFVEGEMIAQDATAWWPAHIRNVDAIVTSPPFFDSTRFHLANWMRLWFAGWAERDFREKPLAFVDERQKKDFGIYRPIFRQARERLVPGGVFVLHLGKSKKCDMAEALRTVAEPWFSVEDVYAESVEHCESHGIRDKGTVVQHQYMVLT